ncbi:MAG TPA: hypothetical protein PK351_09975 [Spirochaetota bacterium]|nr:hypothetical protein [Spirochaetota bacterium]
MEKLILKNLKNKNGYVIIFIVVIILVVVSILGATLSLTFQSRAKVSEIDVYRTQALYLAEGFAREVVWRLKNDPNNIPTGKNVDFSTWKGRATMSYQINYPQNGMTTITSTAYVPDGQNNQAVRTIKVIIDSNYEIIYWEEEKLENLN